MIERLALALIRPLEAALPLAKVQSRTLVISRQRLEYVSMSDRDNARQPSRRDFLGTSAKVGAGLALAGAGLDLSAFKTDAAGVTLTYMGLNNNPPFVTGQQDCIKQFMKLNPGVTVKFVPSPITSAD